jgi:hypothetical protein
MMDYPEKITHAELVELGRDWLIRPFHTSAPYGHYGCVVVLTEIVVTNAWGGEQPDVFGFCTGKSILIECKVSRADFLTDREKPFRAMMEMGIGSERWYMAPQGVINKGAVPANWGLLEVTQGRHILVIKRPEEQDRNTASEIAILISALRRLKTEPDGHVAIKKYVPDIGFGPSKNKATFYIAEEEV